MSDHKMGRNKDLRRPPRWLHCPRKGSVIMGKFLPFKTPLDDRYDSQVPEECIFTPAMLISSISSHKIKMGLWIDLTNTTRFYNKDEVESSGISYLKLQCRGHGECPSVEQTKTFIEVCEKFISRNPLEIIGVHCTHGFNRTGFLIASYLAEVHSWSIEAALDTFKKARPPGIYKQDYINELFSRYGDVNDALSAPPLPEWCDEPDDVDDDGTLLGGNIDSESSNYRPPSKKRKEFQKKDPIFMEGVPGVTVVTDPNIIQDVQTKCQQMCGWKGSGFPGSQPVSMDIKNISLLQKKPYKVSWKADGTRYMMLIEDKDKIYFIDRDNCVFKVHDIIFPRRKEPDLHLYGTLLDGEMIIDKFEGHDVPRYLAYDIVKFMDLDVGKTDFDRRMLCIHKEIISTRRKAMEEGRINRMKEPFSIRIKNFYEITLARQLLGEKFSKEISHEVDGLIFQPVPDPYISGRCLDVLKWKPAEMNSVDFKLIITQQSGIGLLPTKIGLLYVGGMNKPFGQIKVTKSLREMNKKIIECKWENNQWVFMRERTDKSFPNAYTTAIGVCDSIKNPVTKEHLFNITDYNHWRPQPKPENSH